MRKSIGPFSICGLSSRLISSLEFYSDLLRWELAAGALLICPKLQSRFLTKVKPFQRYSLKSRVPNWWQHLLKGFRLFQSRSRIGSCSQRVHVRMPCSWKSVCLAVQYLATSMRNSIGPFGLSSRRTSSLEFYSDLLRWELAAGALLICPKLQIRFLTKVNSSQHYSLKTVSKLMTASFEWFQIVSVQKPNRRLFSICPRAYAKQLAQCFCGSAVSSNSHKKFHWPIQYLWPQ